MANFTKLDWDTEQIGLQCGLLDCSSRITNNEKTLFSNITDQIEVRLKTRFIVIKLSIFYSETLNQLIRYGASLIDTELRFMAKITPIHDVFTSGSVVFSSTTNPTPFLSLAEEMKYSRLYQDPRLSKITIKKMWEESIRNQCNGFTEEVAVAYKDKKPVGLTTLKFTDEKTINLFTVGVLKSYQHLGIGKQMLGSVLNKYQKSKIILVDTSSKNLNAQNLYQKVGFNLNSMHYILHYFR
jgi:ribosomal protein S18 acetylase RimI-like enzyme